MESVVAGKNDDGVVGIGARFECVENRANLIVDERNASHVSLQPLLEQLRFLFVFEQHLITPERIQTGIRQTWSAIFQVVILNSRKPKPRIKKAL